MPIGSEAAMAIAPVGWARGSGGSSTTASRMVGLGGAGAGGGLIVACPLRGSWHGDQAADVVHQRICDQLHALIEQQVPSTSNTSNSLAGATIWSNTRRV